MEKTKDREQWRMAVGEAKAHPGLQCREDGWMETMYKKLICYLVTNTLLLYESFDFFIAHFVKQAVCCADCSLHNKQHTRHFTTCCHISTQYRMT